MLSNLQDTRVEIVDVRTPQSVRNGRVMVCVTTTFTTFTALEPADFVRRNCRMKFSSKRVSVTYISCSR